jgi:hypothetical protein
MQLPPKTEFCASGHPIADAREFRARVRNIRPWPELGLVVGECLCGGTLSYPEDSPVEHRFETDEAILEALGVER